MKLERCGLGVTLDAGSQQPLVLTLALLEVLAHRQHGEAVALTALPQRPDQPRHPPRASRVVEGEMERRVRRPQPREIALLAAGSDVGGELLRGQDRVLLAESLGRMADGQRLE